MEFVETKPENIYIAACDGDLARVVELLNEGVSVNAQDETGYSALHAAASYGQLSMLEFLVAQGANVHIMDSDGDTPLLFCEDPETFEALIRHGADPHKRNFLNEGIFEKVLDDENLNMIQYLVMKGLVDPEVAATAVARLQNDAMDAEGVEYDEEVGEEEEGGEGAPSAADDTAMISDEGQGPAVP